MDSSGRLNPRAIQPLGTDPKYVPLNLLAYVVDGLMYFNPLIPSDASTPKTPLGIFVDGDTDSATSPSTSSNEASVPLLAGEKAKKDVGKEKKKDKGKDKDKGKGKESGKK